jgi:hypothetical protein
MRSPDAAIHPLRLMARSNRLREDLHQLFDARSKLRLDANDVPPCLEPLCLREEVIRARSTEVRSSSSAGESVRF